MQKKRIAAALAVLVLASAPARAQFRPSTAANPNPQIMGLATNVIVPQSGAFVSWDQAAYIEMVSVEAGLVIVEQVATTTVQIRLRNRTRQRQEAELIMPVPATASVRSFDFQGAASEPMAELLRREEAHAIYDGLVNRVRDPALLEFIGYNLIRSSVFPVEPGGEQILRLTYEEILPADGQRVDYVLPRSEALAYAVPWTISAKIQSQRPISTVYSPTHEVETVYAGEKRASVRMRETTASPGSFRLSYLLGGDDVTASFLAYPDPESGGGYFLLLAGLPQKKAREQSIRREVTLVIDRSGSMNGEKLLQVREAAFQVIEGLDYGEAFNIIVYNESVELFRQTPVEKNERSLRQARSFIEGIRARGGTNIHDALVEALQMKPVAGTLPVVLFLTDGLPTLGQTSEIAIRDLATKANPHRRRVFTFGVGVDVNTALLENLAFATRAKTSFVLPKEDVELKVAEVFKGLSGPVLADPRLEILDSSGRPAPQRVLDLYPVNVPDLFAGDQLVLLGRYRGRESILFRLSGNYLGRTQTFQFTFPTASATTRNAFVPRLWASRKIGMLVNGIRRLGADLGIQPRETANTVEPRLRELVNEVVALSTEFGVLTEYTAFLAREGTDLNRPDLVLAEATKNFRDRALAARSGLGSVNQDSNLQSQKAQKCLNYSNSFFDAKMGRVAIDTVQQISDRAFYKRGERWVESRLIQQGGNLKIDQTIPFRSAAYFDLARKLARQGRQGCVSLNGDILMLIDKKTVLVKGPDS